MTFRNTFSPLGAEEFSKEFSSYLFISLLDLFFKYDYVKLDPLSKDIITFSTPIKLFKIYTLP